MLHLCYFILMQYKFFVDGEWRHDEHQPFVSGNGGVVNTIFITGPDMVPAGFSPETLGRSNMDVDDVFLRTADPSQEAVPRMSGVDLELSRHRISVLLSTRTAYELLPESGKVIALDVNLPVKQAFHILYEQVYFICQLPLCQLLFLLGCSSLCLSPSYKHSNIVASRPGKGRK
jgi:hypothetical protein